MMECCAAISGPNSSIASMRSSSSMRCSAEQIRDIVELQLERVKRTAHGQGIDLEIDK